MVGAISCADKITAVVNSMTFNLAQIVAYGQGPMGPDGTPIQAFYPDGQVTEYIIASLLTVCICCL
jgi:hypothetical protein